MNPRVVFDPDVARPHAGDYEAYAAGAPRSGAHCSGCSCATEPLEAVGAVHVPEADIDEVAKIVAHGAASEAARELKVSRPDVKWFATRPGGQVANGWYFENDRGTVWIKAGLSEADIERVVRHESHHRAQHLAGRPVTEAGADAFAAAPNWKGPGVIVTPMPRRTIIAGDVSGRIA